MTARLAAKLEAFGVRHKPSRALQYGACGLRLSGFTAAARTAIHDFDLRNVRFWPIAQ